jgi:hypothetical protein
MNLKAKISPSSDHFKKPVLNLSPAYCAEAGFGITVTIQNREGDKMA